jgi:hypothetical protein
MSFSCGCLVLSGRVLCVGLITRPEECDRGASIMMAVAHQGLLGYGIYIVYISIYKEIARTRMERCLSLIHCSFVTEGGKQSIVNFPRY